MIRLDKVDNKIIELLGDNKKMNLSQLWLKSFSKEGQKCFRKRLDRLKELNIIEIETFPFLRGVGYVITLKWKK